MSQEIKTYCDICKARGDRFPSWFSITEKPVAVGTDNLVKMIPDKVDWSGYARFEKYIDLCAYHRDSIVEAIQTIIDESGSRE